MCVEGVLGCVRTVHALLFTSKEVTFSSKEVTFSGLFSFKVSILWGAVHGRRRWKVLVARDDVSRVVARQQPDVAETYISSRDMVETHNKAWAFFTRQSATWHLISKPSAKTSRNRLSNFRPAKCAKRLWETRAP